MSNRICIELAGLDIIASSLTLIVCIDAITNIAKTGADWRSHSNKPIHHQHHFIHREHQDICDQRLDVVYEHDDIRYKRESDRKLTDVISTNFFVWLYVTRVEDYL
ncbi:MULTISPECIES: hypothetical protein [Fischerella]|uniref:hypothetical protein n=1 Tax=Fischerella TaxID=1190 RepID=UPI0011AF524F|nr:MULTISPECIES: hypothetical protein [Fischerella]MBD2433091.1 hypothetical protein [Fischerella sp. FACHB-380]